MPLTRDDETKNGTEGRGKMGLERWSWIASIGAAILGFVAYFVNRNDLFAFWKSSGRIIATPFLSAWNFFAHPVTWPVWALVLLVISGLAIAVAVVLFVLWRVSKETQQAPESTPIRWQDYRSDEIFGVRWSWAYVYGQLDNLVAYCPRKGCMHRLESRTNRLLDANSAMLTGLIATDSLFCRRCGFQQDLNTDLEHQKPNVVFEIERLINTGEFRHRSIF